MKKILFIFSTILILCSCGKYKELNKEEKFSLLYEAEILQKKDAREEVNKIYKSLGKYIAKNDEKALKEMEQYEDITYYLRNSSRNYKSTTVSWNVFKNDEVKFPLLEEVIDKTGKPVSFVFRLYSDNKDIYDYLTDKPFTGTAINRLGNGEVSEVVIIENGKIKNTIQKNKFTDKGKIVQEEFYDNNKKLVASRKYTVQGALKEENYILERYPNGNVKRDYIRLNGEEKGKLRTYNSKKVIISQEEK